MDTLRDILTGLAHRGSTAVQSLLGRERAHALRRWFSVAYRDQPLLFGLVVTWLAFCAVPLAAFVGYAVLWAVVAFSVFWAIFLFWSGVGLLFLVPALCVATGLSVVFFMWAVATYFVSTRVLTAAGFDLPALFGGNSSKGASYKPSSSSTYLTKSEKPPSYALHPVPATKTFDAKAYNSFASTGLDKAKPVVSLHESLPP
ncbi:hypothetical protein Sste5346_003526 [Sporothrix stenoceras]|uniref:Uncharacterized protein n=1 Tax=Sporothrix stenoceras TaxID=5173 RepID=A0ABR3ZCP4_9PEZI